MKDALQNNEALKNLFIVFQNVDRPDKLISCDCGSCFSSRNAEALYSQSLENMPSSLVWKFFNDQLVLADKKGFKYLFPAFAKTLSDQAETGEINTEFMMFVFGRSLQQADLESWSSSEQAVLWDWFESLMCEFLQRGNLDDFDEMVCSLIRPEYNWTRYTALLLKPRFRSAKLGHIAYFCPWANNYEAAPSGFEITSSDSDGLAPKHKEAYYGWMLDNISESQI